MDARPTLVQALVVDPMIPGAATPMLDVFLSLGLATAIGLLVGLERERHATEDPGDATFAGVRSFTLLALSGAICGLLMPALGAWIVIAGLAVTAAFVGLAYHRDLVETGDPGLTTEVASLLVFLLGVLAAVDVLTPLRTRLIVVGALGITVATVLNLKPQLHGLARRLTREDVLGTLQFLIAAAVVLPLVPDRTYDPLDVINPYQTVLMIVLIAGISFVGYVAVRIAGPGRGMGITGILGGLVSSTAITLSMATRARAEPLLRSSCLLAVLAACAIMFVRVIVEVAVVNMSLVPAVAAPLGAMFVVGMLAAAWAWRATRGDKAVTGQDIELKNPFQLTSAVAFGLLFAGVLFISKAATVYAGDAGVYLAGVIAGATDVDAITLSMASLAGESISHATAATTILLATASNVVVKGGMAMVVGGRAFGLRVIAAFAATIAAGGLGMAGYWLI